MSNRQCGNELPGPGDVQKVQDPVSQQNAEDGYNHLMFVKVIALLLSNQDDNNDVVLNNQRLGDLAELLFFLVEHPSDVLGAVASEKEPGPDPGRNEAVLASIKDPQIHKARPELLELNEVQDDTDQRENRDLLGDCIAIDGLLSAIIHFDENCDDAERACEQQTLAIIAREKFNELREGIDRAGKKLA